MNGSFQKIYINIDDFEETVNDHKCVTISV
jgi:hypothetical protein